MSQEERLANDKEERLANDMRHRVENLEKRRAQTPFQQLFCLQLAFVGKEAGQGRTVSTC
jgi:hypothetical protein